MAVLLLVFFPDVGVPAGRCGGGGTCFEGDEFGDEHAVARQIELHCQGQPFWFVCLPPDQAAGFLLIAHSRRAAAGFEQLQEQAAIEYQLRVTVLGQLQAESLPKQVTLLASKDAQSKLLIHSRQPAFEHLQTLLIEQGWQVVTQCDEQGETLTQDISLTGLSFICPLEKEPRHLDLATLMQ